MLALILLLSILPPARAADAVPVPAYFPVLPFDAPPDAPPQFVPVAFNHAMDGGHAGVTRAIIVIHDEGRDASGAMTSLSALAGNLNRSTLILAPQFLLPSDLANFAAHLPDKGRDFASWSPAGWAQGDDSTLVPGRKAISSFTVTDLLLMYLGDRRNFPDLRDIVLAGFGAGSLYVTRYAAFGIALDPVKAEGIHLHVVAAAPPSFLYLTATRPRFDKKGVQLGFGPPDQATCPAFDDYPYGMQKLPPYPRRAGANQAKLDYPTRQIAYLTNAGGSGDTSCAAQAQGSDSAARLAAYRNYLQTLFGDDASTQSFVVVKGSGDAVSLFGSACGMAALFGDGSCAPGFGDSP